MSKTYTERERSLALKRALKFSKLFNGKNFDNILNAIQPPNQLAFTKACEAAGLIPSEINWLWNYLQHCGDIWTHPPDVVDLNEAIASTGW
jgi:hypothetical protein